ncbi:MAG: hypothetical protein PF569_05245 [Candidatus Woesearchaeota archaeon]|nr:hypothetical protein [Candidatus Woesearchaeota archaeon]
MENKSYRIEKEISKDCSFKIFGEAGKFIVLFNDGKFVESMELSVDSKKNYIVSGAVGCCQFDKNKLTYYKPQGISNYCREEIVGIIKEELPIIDYNQLEKTLVEFNNS